jgi:methanethiol S-methyltransferase
MAVDIAGHFAYKQGAHLHPLLLTFHVSAVPLSRQHGVRRYEMGRILALIYGVVCYVIFLATFLYAIGFVGNFVVPKSIDSGPPAATLTRALIMNVILLSIFAIQHSVMARPGFKKVWTRFVPVSIERSTFVLFSSLALILLFWQWRPMTDVIWDVRNPFGQYALWGLFAIGWGTVLLSTYLINHFDLFGLRQVYIYAKGDEYHHVGFKALLLYKVVRHPIMLGFIIAFWATPTMTAGHLLFAAVTTAYILVAIQLEERDSVNFMGDEYLEYRSQVAMLVPFAKRRAAVAEKATDGQI